jgi:FAD/FMN-containing dehydrogenase
VLSALPRPAALAALKAIVGPSGYLDEPPDVEPFLTDFRRLYHGRTPLVLIPASTAEVSAIARLCQEQGIGIVPHGGNTSYCGGATPDESGTQVVLAMRRLNRIREVDAENFALTAEAGCVLAEVQAAADRVDRLFPMSLGSEGSCQIGGNLSTNAGGTAVLRYGMMRDLVLGLEVVLADGRVLEGLRSLRKDNRGYDLKQLFIGSEGTLGIVTAATLKLFPKPAGFATAIAAVRDPAAAVALLSELRSAVSESLTTFELMPRIALDLTVRHIPGVKDPLPNRYGWYVLIELSTTSAGDSGQAMLEGALARSAEAGLVIDAALASSLQQREQMWRLRESIPEAQRQAGAGLKHDLSVPISRLADFVGRGAAWVAANVPDGELIAYGHVGDGNLHFNVQQNAGGDAASFLARAPVVRRALHDLAAQCGGSFSAEHGVGRSKVEELERYKEGVEIELMRAIKQTLDPKGILNPGKVLKSRREGAGA